MAAKKVVVDLYYDIISPYSYVCFEMLCRYRHEWHSMSLKFKPFLLGVVMKESGNKAPLFVPNKAIYMPRDLSRLSNYYKIPLSLPENFVEVALEKTTIKPQRFLTAIDMLTNGERTEQLSRELWKRLFVNHQDVTLADSLREAAKCAAIDAQVIEKAIDAMEQIEVKEQLKKCTNEAVTYGAFGAPTTVVHLPKGPEMVFGSDRIEIIGSLLGEKYVGPLEKFSKL